ncbi:MAG TPA: trypsin-like serine protease [candidate division WWE3 bacterium]|uniref:Trypsin-like serine protease n=1 Tax=candidate division WWE3 bacterium TaxID=2053526 RepID=A0A7C1S9Z3_UNCKA|nr:trypsin-like serine protease [candidate division WWE3 bacterium]
MPRFRLIGKIKKKHLLITLLLVVGAIVYLYRAPIFSFIQDRLTLEIRTIREVVSEEGAVISVVEKASPAVVSIVEKKVILNPFSGPLSQEQGIGTGFIVNANGTILTNKHVVSDQDVEYSVVTSDGKQYEIKEIHRDTLYDLAILKVNASGLPTLSLGDSNLLKVGQTVVAIGNALGQFSNTVTRGVVSGVGRGITAGSVFGGQTQYIDDVIQTDAAINPGNSGGPLLNLSAEVIGINVAMASGAENIGFSIPISLIKPVVAQFESDGRIIRPFLGVSYYLITENEAQLRGLPQGVFVQKVITGSAAKKAGVRVGDVITKIDGKEITQTNSLAKVISAYNVGDSITLTVSRKGKILTLKATLREAPTN